MTLNGTIAGGGPKTTDGRGMLLTSRFREDIDPYFPGCGDSADTVGGGPDFLISWATDPGSSEDKYVEWFFCDWVDVAYGGLSWSGGDAGDYITMKVYAPATVVTTAVPENTGNVNLVATGFGFNLLVPAPDNGTHTVLEADMIPVPSADNTGYWDWDYPDTGSGTVSEASFANQGQFNLFDASLDLVFWVRRFQLVGSNLIQLQPETRTRTVLPHWKWKVEVHTEGGHAPIHLTWFLCTGRKRTL